MDHASVKITTVALDVLLILVFVIHDVVQAVLVQATLIVNHVPIKHSRMLEENVNVKMIGR